MFEELDEDRRMNLRTPAADEMILVAIRHGETEGNASRLYVGQTESPLSAQGVAQAAALGERLKHISLDAVYSSDLSRAADTAAAVAGHHSLDPTFDERLRERHYGVLEGGGYETEARERFSEVCDGLETASPAYAIPDGESAEQVRGRLSQFLNEIRAKHTGETVVAVAHGGVIRILLWHLLELPYPAAQYSRCENTSVSVFRFFRGGWHLDLWNDTGHLGFAD